MKKYLIIVGSVLLVLVLGLLVYKHITNQGKISLEKKYYNEGNFIKVSSEDLNKLDDENYILFTYNNYCTLKIPCEDIFKAVMKKHHIDVLSIGFEDFRNSKFYEEVKYAPSIIIISHGKIVSYLDANLDDDLDKYQDENAFEKWLSSYVIL